MASVTLEDTDNSVDMKPLSSEAEECLSIICQALELCLSCIMHTIVSCSPF